jgi:hypothetical protein
MTGGRFEPKTPVNLDPPKSDPISLDELAKANGKGTYDPSKTHYLMACIITCRQRGAQGKYQLSLSFPPEQRCSPLVPFTNVRRIGADGGKCYVAIKVTQTEEARVTLHGVQVAHNH